MKWHLCKIIKVGIETLYVYRSWVTDVFGKVGVAEITVNEKLNNNQLNNLPGLPEQLSKIQQCPLKRRQVKLPKDPIKTDDVLDMYQFLKKFDGDFIKLFGEGDE